ncbi:MAG: hypothetical protein LBR95_02155 [Azoarcus sp.]|jgi:hypothetical protein|nr:hypothetical protein [Azoarcus sp.]
MSNKAIAIATFCDDVRSERGNKYSVMGCYGPEMIVDNFPMVFARLCAMVVVAIPLDLQVENLFLRATLNNDLLAELPMSNISSVLADANKNSRDGRTKLDLRAFMTFSPLLLTEESDISIKACFNEEHVHAGTLHIRQRKDGDPQF